MQTLHDISVQRLGFRSAVLCTIFSLAYVLAQLAEWAGLLGSAGGPHSRSTSFGLILLLTPSLLLGVTFVVLMVSVHYYAARRPIGSGVISPWCLPPCTPPHQHRLLRATGVRDTAAGAGPYRRHRVADFRTVRFFFVCRRRVRLQPDESGDVVCRAGIQAAGHRALDPAGVDRQRLPDTVSSAADVQLAADLGRQPAGCYFFRLDLAVGNTFQAVANG